ATHSFPRKSKPLHPTFGERARPVRLPLRGSRVRAGLSPGECRSATVRPLAGRARYPRRFFSRSWHCPKPGKTRQMPGPAGWTRPPDTPGILPAERRIGRVAPLPRERGCVRRTSRGSPECPDVVKRPQRAARADLLRLVLRTQPRSVSHRFSLALSRCARRIGRVASVSWQRHLARHPAAFLPFLRQPFEAQSFSLPRQDETARGQ